MAEPRRLYEQIAQQLAKAIADGKYEVGQRLPSERELAQTFDVSRPTVREAIIALELDELVEVRLGSGVYVMNRQPPGGAAGYKDIGFFELLEARRAIEGEACAMAAMRIDDAQLEQLSELIEEMRDDNRHDEILMSEDADRRFHELIASSTQNSWYYRRGADAVGCARPLAAEPLDERQGARARATSRPSKNTPPSCAR